MKTVPFEQSFIIEEFILTHDLIDRGYHILTMDPLVETVKVKIEETESIIFPQFTIFQITSDFKPIFPDVPDDKYIINWLYNSSSSTGDECFIPDLKWELEGTLKDIFEKNIGKYVQISYVSRY